MLSVSNLGGEIESANGTEEAGESPDGDEESGGERRDGDEATLDSLAEGFSQRAMRAGG